MTDAQFQGQNEMPVVTGPWTPADKTSNHLEFATTTQENVLALRSTFNPQQYIFATRQQITELVSAFNAGTLRTLGLNG